MSFLLDTNFVSAHLRDVRSLAHRFIQHGGQMYMSTVSLAELLVWANRSPNSVRRRDAIEQVLRRDASLLSFDEACAGKFAYLQSRGVAVHALDLQIAATALAHDLMLVTHNTRDFERIPDLRPVDWLEGS